MDLLLRSFHLLAAVLAALAEAAAIALIWGYRLFIKPLFPATCRYRPSCSEYALQAVRRFGAVRGSWLAACRLARCNPWGGCGADPVPEKWPGGPFRLLRREHS